MSERHLGVPPRPATTLSVSLEVASGATGEAVMTLQTYGSFSSTEVAA